MLCVSLWGGVLIGRWLTGQSDIRMDDLALVAAQFFFVYVFLCGMALGVSAMCSRRQVACELDPVIPRRNIAPRRGEIEPFVRRDEIHIHVEAGGIEHAQLEESIRSTRLNSKLHRTSQDRSQFHSCHNDVPRFLALETRSELGFPLEKVRFATLRSTRTIIGEVFEQRLNRRA